MLPSLARHPTFHLLHARNRVCLRVSCEPPLDSRRLDSADIDPSPATHVGRRLASTPSSFLLSCRNKIDYSRLVIASE